MIKKYAFPLVFSFLAAVPGRALAQPEAQATAGYVVLANGDTLRGVLDVPRFVTDYGVRFSAAPGGPAQPYKVADLRAFGLVDGRRYVRRTIANGTNDATGRVDSATIFLQQLVSGAGSFYRYDYNAALRGEGIAAQSETIRYYGRVPGSSLVPLRRVSYQGVLAALLNDCPVVAAEASHMNFSEDALAKLFLRYNAQCYPAVGFRDQRLPPDSTNFVRVVLGLRGGMQHSLLYYNESNKFERDHTTGASGVAFSGEVRFRWVKSPWSVALGLMYSRQQSTATYSESAFAGTTNAGEILDLSSAIRVRAIQVPILVYYTLGHRAVQPYLAAGIMPGTNKNETQLRYLSLTAVGPASPTVPFYRQDAVAETRASKTSLSFGGVARAGLRLALTPRLAPLLEGQVGFGYHRHSFPEVGDIPYQTWGLLAGFEF